jgi:hypothetical protein
MGSALGRRGQIFTFDILEDDKPVDEHAPELSPVRVPATQYHPQPRATASSARGVGVRSSLFTSDSRLGSTRQPLSALITDTKYAAGMGDGVGSCNHAYFVVG